MKNDPALVRFDWAVKRLLRNKSNFVVLEGFLSTLLGQEIRIVKMLESESNKESVDNKFNPVEMLAEDSKGELIIIELHNNRELYYYHRMLYGAPKTTTDYINEGQEYGVIRKVYSINIVYFELGQGKDYVYHGRTSFKGIHYNDILQLSVRQREQFVRHEVGDIFPEYYVLRVDGFNQQAKTPLDEWIAFLKTGEINKNSTVHGLQEARERLRIDQLDEKDRRQYYTDMEALRYQRSVIKTGWIEGWAEGIAEEKAEVQRLIAINLKQNGVDPLIIARSIGLSIEEIEQL